MGSVLAFAPRDTATVRRPLPPGDTASIVIFPGIRYERHQPNDGPGTTANHSETKRGKPRPRH
jgi:hypothetical protein